MKKILLIIFSLLCLFVGSDVFAKSSVFSGAEFLDGVSYVKYDGNYYYFRNAQVIRNLDTGNIAYCIEPFSALVDGTEYFGYDSYNNVFDLTQEQWDRINLLAHYGYGYGNHVEEKWITITQFLIWRTVDFNSSFNWLDNLTDRNIIYPYESEILELESLVNSHYVLPSFSSNIKMGINSTLNINDSNGVLNKYEIIYSDFDSYIDGNNLVINSKEEMDGKIKFKLKQYSNDDVYFFYANNTQSVVESGNSAPIYFEIDVEVVSGKLTIKKVDSVTKEDNPQGSASLIGAVYDVFNSDSTLVGEVVIGEDSLGIIENLPFGKYYVIEKKAGEGYYVDDRTKHEFVINENNFNIYLTLENEVITSKIKVIKHFGSVDDYLNKNMKPEVGIGFNFYDSLGNLVYEGVTNELGIIELVLPYGEYIIKQVNTTEGYTISNDIKINVNESSNISITLNIYDYKIDVPNAFIGFYDYFFEMMKNIKEMMIFAY